MNIQTTLPQLEALFSPWRDALGDDYTPYRNHVYRMVHFCLALHPCSEAQREQVLLAGCYHDIGIWPQLTLDYLPPSSARALEHLATADAGSREAVRLMIELHHKLRAYQGPHQELVEAFRKADLVDLSFGALRFGLPRDYVAQVRAQFPNAGFHKRLLQLAGPWLLHHPLRPLPFLKW